MQVCCNVLWPMKLLVTTINEINQFGTYEPTVNQHTLPCVWQYCTSCHVCAHNACCFLSHIIYSFSVIYGNTQSLFYAINSTSKSKSETWVTYQYMWMMSFLIKSTWRKLIIKDMTIIMKILLSRMRWSIIFYWTSLWAEMVAIQMCLSSR